MKNEVPAWVGITYLIYVVAMVSILWGGVGYAVFVLGHTGWWFLLSLFLTSCLYSPWRWHSIYTGVEVPVSRYKPTTGK